MTDPRQLHDADWAGTKASDSFYSGSGRYPKMAGVIAALGPKRLLDAGCGSGYLASLVKAAVPGVSMDGADISGVALERAKAHFARTWQVNLDTGELPAGSGEYDTAVCVEVLEHLYDPAGALSKIRACLAPGGRLVCTVPNLAYWRYRLQLLSGRVPSAAADPRHLHSFSAASFAGLLGLSGYSVLNMTGFGERLPRLAAAYPQLFSDILIAVAVKK